MVGIVQGWKCFGLVKRPRGIAFGVLEWKKHTHTRTELTDSDENKIYKKKKTDFRLNGGRSESPYYCSTAVRPTETHTRVPLTELAYAHAPRRDCCLGVDVRRTDGRAYTHHARRTLHTQGMFVARAHAYGGSQAALA